MRTDITDQDLAVLREFDTPTICNAIEILAPERRIRGFTIEPLICSFPDLPPMVGYARTAVIRAMHKPEGTPEEVMAKRISYYEYVENGPRPSVVVLQDIDSIPGYGSFWGEVQSNVHKGLGALGTITNGCVRDIDACAEGFQFLSGSIKPSHAWVHVVEFGTDVSVAGMEVKSGDLIHADRHGAVVVPKEIVRDIAKTVDVLAKREAVVIEAARKSGFSVEDLREAFKKQQDIH